MDRAWVGDVLARFAGARPDAPELPLLRVRHAVLGGTEPPAAAAAAYERIAQATHSAARFTFTGLEDARRLDSYYDPFGTLRVHQRALVEAAREWVRAGRPARAAELGAALLRTGAWTPLRRAQFAESWGRYVSGASDE